MAFFDKLKEKVNKVVDVDKLTQKATAIKNNFDPAVREQERLEREERERLLAEAEARRKAEAEEKKAREEEERKAREEEEKKQKEIALNDFWATVDVDKELDAIFSVLEKGRASATNFEKGIEHMLSKAESILTLVDVLSTFKKRVFTLAFGDAQNAVAKVIAADYFIDSVVSSEMLKLYMSYEIMGETLPSAREPFIKSLYGVGGRAVNYIEKRFREETYQAMTADDFIPVIENSDVLKSYTDEDPFTADDVRKQWAEEICASTSDLLKTDFFDRFVEEDVYVDALCYYAYLMVRQDKEESVDDINVTKVTNAYFAYLKEYYSTIRR